MRKTRTLLLALSLGLCMSAYAAHQDTEPTDGKWIFKFEDGNGNTTWYTSPEEAYLFEAGDNGGTITFNTRLSDSDKHLLVTGDFKMVGSKFTIDVAGNYVDFSQPMANYGTDFIVKSTGEHGEVTTHSDAAFRNLTIESGGFVVNSQIGITSKFTISEGAYATIAKDALMLFTQQIHNEGTLYAYGTIDASNITATAASDLGIKFENIDGETEGVTSGYLFANDNTRWNISDGTDETLTGTTYSDDLDGGHGQLRIGTLTYDIVDADDDERGKGGYVLPGETSYDMWFQNYGTGTVNSIIAKRAESLGTPDFIVRNGGEKSRTTLDVDIQFIDTSVIAVSRGAYARINLIDREIQGETPEHTEWVKGAIGTFKVYDGADVEVTSFGGESARMNHAIFAGQNIKITSVGSESDTDKDFSPMSLTVESASSVLISSNIHCTNGYFAGEDVQMGPPDRRVGDYQILGVLTMDGKYTFDLTNPDYDTSTKANFTKGNLQGEKKEGAIVNNPIFSEQFTHLTIGNDGAVVLKNGSVFKANTVLDAVNILNDSGTNLNTVRTSESSVLNDQNDVEYNAKPSYTINGTIEVTGRADGQTSITAKGEMKMVDDVLTDVGPEHYTTRNKNYTISNADIKVTDAYGDGYNNPKTGSGDTTISNVLIGDSVTNSRATSHGTVTLDNEANQNFTLIYAQEGDIAITNRKTIEVEVPFGGDPVQKLEDVNAATIHIGAGKTVSVSGTLVDAVKEATLNVTNLLQADGYQGGDKEKPAYSKIDADLRLGVGAELDVSAAKGFGGIDMLSNTVTFSTVYSEEASKYDGFILSDADYKQLWAMSPKSMYDLFWHVSATDFDGFGVPSDVEIPVGEIDASHYISNLEEGCFYLCYSGTGEGGAGGNVGTIYLYSMVPEPTTGTLSLLALAGLAARRRRK